MDTTVLLVDDHPVFREGLRHLIENSKGIKVVGEAADGQAAIELVRQLSPQVVVMDISMPDFNGIEATEQIVSEHPQTKVMALSIHSGKRFVEGMLRAGAAGYVLKESAPEELVRGIRSVQQGEVFLSAAISGVVVAEYLRVLSRNGTSQDRVALTDREQRVLHLMAKGTTDEEIRVALGLSAKVVASTQKRIMTKLGVSNAAELMAHLRATQWAEGEALLKVGGSNGHPTQAPSQPILATKLHHPPTYLEVVPRTDLLKQLEEGRKRRLTLVSAPAGYGKSTLVSQWLATCSGPSAWLSLDDSDNDLRLFLTYLLCAIQSAAPMVGQRTRTLLEAVNLPPPSDLARYLLTDLDEVTDPFILVLDDYHHIHTQPVHELLSALIDHDAPAMHLVLVTRRDPPLPITRLRARDQLTEIALQQLRFTPAEIAVFLREALCAPVAESVARIVEQKTEGWVTGLRLIMLSIRDREDLDRVVGSLSGEFHRITHYLIQEVLAQQPRSVRRHLLQTSILNRFCAPLCDALNGADGVGDDGQEAMAGQAFLEWLRNANLFAIPLDEEHHWFRYHHLFAQLLKTQLLAEADVEQVTELRKKASAWFAENDFAEEAIDHAVDAEDYVAATRIFLRERDREINADRWHVLARWLSKFPNGIQERHAGLLLTQAWVSYFQFRMIEIPAILEQVETVFRADGSHPAYLGELNFFKGALSYWQGESKRSQQYQRKALELIPTENYLRRGEAELFLGIARQLAGKTQLAVRDLNDRLRATPVQHHTHCTRLAAGLAFVHVIAGELRPAAQASLRIQDAGVRGNVLYSLGWSQYLQGLICFHLNDCDGAIKHFSWAAENRYVFHTRGAVDSFIGLAIAYHFAGESTSVDETLAAVAEFATETGDRQNIAAVDSARCRLALLRGDDQSAFHSLEFIDAAPDPLSMFIWLEVSSITRCRVLLSTGTESHLAEAAAILDTFCQKAKGIHNTAQLIEMMPLYALVLHKQGKSEQANSVLEEAVSIAQPGGWIRPFVEAGAPMVELLDRLPGSEQTAGFVEQILRACGTRVAGSAPHRGRASRGSASVGRVAD